MARTFSNEAMARCVVQLRSAARRGDSDALEGAIADLERSFTASATLSKHEASRVLHVSVNTLDKWIDRGLIPTISVEGYQRARLPAAPVLRLAVEVEELRRRGQDQALLADAVSRLEQKDPSWREDFEDLYGQSLRAMQRGDLVRVRSEDFGPDD